MGYPAKIMPTVNNTFAAHFSKGAIVPSYLQTASTPRKTPQSEAIPGSGQTENAAGGFAWQIGSMERLRRFLVLGSEGGTYYA